MKYSFVCRVVCGIALFAQSTVAVFAQNTFPSSGSVGIGTTSPAELLHVTGANPVIFVDGDINSYYSGIRIRSLSGDGLVNNYGIVSGNEGLHLSSYGHDLGVTQRGILSLSSVPGNVTHKILAASGQTADIFRVSQNLGTLGIPVENSVFTVNSAGNIHIGTQANVMTSTPGYLSLGASYSNVPGSNLKLRLYDPNDINYTYGLGISASQMDFSVPSLASYAFYIDGVKKFSIVNNGIMAETGDYFGIYKNNGTALPIKTGGLTISDSYTDNAGTNGLWVKGVSYLAGNVGIGTSSVPSTYKLAVAGKIITDKIRVAQQSNWPDYVFGKQYKLMPLSELEQYIQSHQHLPEVPSAKEVEEKGIDLGDNQALLLKKIEEQTLYIIEQNKKIELLLQRIEALEKNR